MMYSTPIITNIELLKMLSFMLESVRATGKPEKGFFLLPTDTIEITMKSYRNKLPPNPKTIGRICIDDTNT